MPGYIHTCAGCGAHMQVHERYLGRTLKCTSCRREFLAEMPEGIVAEEPVVVAVDDTESKKGPGRFLWLLVVLIPLVCLIWWVGQDHNEGVGKTIFRAERAVGDNATLDTSLEWPVLVALDHDSVGALVDMQSGAADVGVTSLVNNNGRILEIETGTRIRILELTNKSREARVRILDGPWESRIVWVPADWIR